MGLCLLHIGTINSALRSMVTKWFKTLFALFLLTVGTIFQSASEQTKVLWTHSWAHYRQSCGATWIVLPLIRGFIKIYFLLEGGGGGGGATKFFFFPFSNWSPGHCVIVQWLLFTWSGQVFSFFTVVTWIKSFHENVHCKELRNRYTLSEVTTKRPVGPVSIFFQPTPSL